MSAFGLRTPSTTWFCAALLLLMGCAGRGSVEAKTPVPAARSYCFSTSTDAGFRARLQDSTATYGTRNMRWIGNGSVCDLIHFETYVVSWQTRDGRSERFEFDFDKIMRKFQDETPLVHTLTRHTSQPDLFLAFHADQIKIYYRVSQYPEGGMEMRNGLQILTKPPVVTQFPLLTVPLTPAAVAPDRK